MTRQVKDLIILITGSTDGIGRLAALKLAGKNATLLTHGRDRDKVRTVSEAIKKESGNNNIFGFTADLASLSEVRQFASDVSENFPKIDILINNAGVGFADKRYSKDGFELRFAVNYLAVFLLTTLLLPALDHPEPSRIVNVSSAGQHPLDFDDIMMERDFNPGKAYGQSKLALIMYTFELAKRLVNTNITVNSLHPGTYLDTNMVRRAGITPWNKPETGAEAEVFLAISDKLEGVTGKYFNVKTESKTNSQAYDEGAREKLWEISLELTGLNYK